MTHGVKQGDNARPCLKGSVLHRKPTKVNRGGPTDTLSRQALDNQQLHSDPRGARAPRPEDMGWQEHGVAKRPSWAQGRRAGARTGSSLYLHSGQCLRKMAHSGLSLVWTVSELL